MSRESGDQLTGNPVPTCVLTNDTYKQKAVTLGVNGFKAEIFDHKIGNSYEKVGYERNIIGIYLLL